MYGAVMCDLVDRAKKICKVNFFTQYPSRTIDNIVEARQQLGNKEASYTAHCTHFVKLSCVSHVMQTSA